ncbi:MAG: AzlC family ABC transporter permease, partial [Oscillospiraceae bacterium]|nr:AzlC family ABC transporter permease [Oscillospiraceae bacterium]
LLELAVSQIVINLRYALMSVSLSQKLGESIRLPDRFFISFVNTDEVFAVASEKEGTVGRKYMYGLILMPYLGWSIGTLVGAAAGQILPPAAVSALGIAIYGMFVAIVVPVMKVNRRCLVCVLFAVALSCAFKYMPYLKEVPSGFTVIICAVAASALFAVVAPVNVEESEENA